jgi:hypothetical protein
MPQIWLRPNMGGTMGNPAAEVKGDFPQGVVFRRFRLTIH